jgi:hypothetical protein
MKNQAAGPVIVGLLALCLMVISAFVPWFKWSFQEGSQAWYESTSVWGPPAYVSGVPYASVDVSVNGVQMVNWAAGVYLLLFLLGIALWIVLLRMLRRKTERRTTLVVLGVGSVVVSVGLVVLLGLAGLIAKRVVLYAAIRSLRIVVAEMAGIRVPGPLTLIVGVMAEAVMVWRMRRQRV